MTTKHPDQTTPALAAFVKLMRAAESVSADVHKHLAEYGLSVSQFGVLEALFHKGSLCQKDLAEKILKTTGNLTMVIENLEKRGLVERTRDQNDRRFLIIALTPEGRELIGTVFPHHAEGISKRFSLLSPEEQRHLGELCRKLGQG